ncbi:TetR family transcriptional regulator [Pimelobacter simplex]|uniref:Transcriptional regulator, TetR family n=1 Tax=Nocardioides simplex TaxID=2045 RepID=A0A0A1DKG9_NOCSI|nr:TetR/AcrR family transcriptional regulator [Pimelobacter simplex]AIY17901.1 Transcriptional regulator, TetR family [Pimelobacter simplex]MCG8152712.1 TetR family transcriptional regulator [Pimelobacter simplex]GEB16916.1 transcriptional regulator [Pimelobacter simplex]SFM74558.1 transcriptional regulator, TetR family [Pimelobacter simplex]
MPRAGLTPDRITAAAADLADRIGYDALTLSALARELGVKTPSLYAHVAGLDALRTDLTRLALDELADRAAAALAGRSGRDALHAFADTYRTYAHAHPGRYEAARAPVTPDSPDSPDSPVIAAGRRNADLTRSVLRGYALAPSYEVHAIRLLGSLVHGFASLELAGSFAHSAPASDESWVAVLDALDATLRGWPA